MKLYDNDGKWLLLVPCAECVYCYEYGDGTNYVCERRDYMEVEPDGFCSWGGKEMGGYIYKTLETMEEVAYSLEGVGHTLEEFGYGK